MIVRDCMGRHAACCDALRASDAVDGRQRSEHAIGRRSAWHMPSTDGLASLERKRLMTNADISRRLNSISKETLFENFSRQLGEMQQRNRALQSDVSQRDAAIQGLRQQVAALQQQVTTLQQQARMDRAASDRLMQSANSEAQGIINDANAKAQAIIQQAQGTSDDANRQAQAIIQQAQAHADEITDTQTRLLRSQVASLQSQKQQAMAEAERCLQGIIDVCDQFESSTQGYGTDLSALRAAASRAVQSIRTEQFVRSSLGNAPAAMPQTTGFATSAPAPMQTPAPTQAQMPTATAAQGDDVFRQSPMDALLNAGGMQPAGGQQVPDDDGDADITAEMLPRRQPPVIDDGGDRRHDDDQLVFDPSDTISPEDAKSFTSEFNLGDLVSDGEAEQEPAQGQDDDGQDDDDDFSVSDSADEPVQSVQPAPKPRHQRKGQWF